MTLYKYSEARQNLASLLQKALDEGEVLIQRKDGTMFIVKPVEKKGSPLDVKGVDAKLDLNEIVDFVRETRERNKSR